MIVEHADPHVPESLNVSVVLPGVLDNSDRKAVERAVLAWYNLGVEHGYGGGFMHFMSRVEWTVDGEESRCQWWMDLGSADPAAAARALVMLLPNVGGKVTFGGTRAI